MALSPTAFVQGWDTATALRCARPAPRLRHTSVADDQARFIGPWAAVPPAPSSPRARRWLNASEYSVAGGNAFPLAAPSWRTRFAAYFRPAASHTSRKSRPDAPSDAAASARWSAAGKCAA